MPLFVSNPQFQCLSTESLSACRGDIINLHFAGAAREEPPVPSKSGDELSADAACAGHESGPVSTGEDARAQYHDEPICNAAGGPAFHHASPCNQNL